MMYMRGHVLFISSAERTVEEAWKSLERFYIGLDIPETFYANLDNPGWLEYDFNYDKDCFYPELLNELYEGLHKMKESNESERKIKYIQKKIERTKAVANNDFVAFINSYHDEFKVREGKIYTTKNYGKGFFDDIFEEPLFLLTDKYGNELESCICKDILFDSLSDKVTAIVWEDSDECLNYDDYDDEVFDQKFYEALKNIPPNNYIRILQYHC